MPKSCPGSADRASSSWNRPSSWNRTWEGSLHPEHILSGAATVGSRLRSRDPHWPPESILKPSTPGAWPTPASALTKQWKDPGPSQVQLPGWTEPQAAPSSPKSGHVSEAGPAVRVCTCFFLSDTDHQGADRCVRLLIASRSLKTQQCSPRPPLPLLDLGDVHPRR